MSEDDEDQDDNQLQLSSSGGFERHICYLWYMWYPPVGSFCTLIILHHHHFLLGVRKGCTGTTHLLPIIPVIPTSGFSLHHSLIAVRMGLYGGFEHHICYLWYSLLHHPLRGHSAPLSSSHTCGFERGGFEWAMGSAGLILHSDGSLKGDGRWSGGTDMSGTQDSLFPYWAQPSFSHTCSYEFCGWASNDKSAVLPAVVSTTNIQH